MLHVFRVLQGNLRLRGLDYLLPLRDVLLGALCSLNRRRIEDTVFAPFEHLFYLYHQ